MRLLAIDGDQNRYGPEREGRVLDDGEDESAHFVFEINLMG